METVHFPNPSYDGGGRGGGIEGSAEDGGEDFMEQGFRTMPS